MGNDKYMLIVRVELWERKYGYDDRVLVDAKSIATETNKINKHYAKTMAELAYEGLAGK